MTASVDTYSEAWRHECEARWVANLPDLERRRNYLDGVAKRRGQAAGDRLRIQVAEVWRARRAQAEPHSPSQQVGAVSDATRNDVALAPRVMGPSPSDSPAGNSNPRGPLGNDARA